MKKVLVINSSARVLNSHSRKLTEVFTDHWQSLHSNAVIKFRELGTENVPHMTQSWITAAFKQASARSAEETEVLKKSDAYISELREADVIVIGAPMYNWSVPSTLKAYIDQILRINETWKADPVNVQNPYIGLLENKTLFLLLSRGSQGYEQGGYNRHMDFQSTYLMTVFNIMGIHDIHIIAISGASRDNSDLNISIETAYKQIRKHIDMELAMPDSAQ
ncbi:FMN-dependent NADH-azoreductase [Dyadobacter sp. CY323]|uniref:FMN-dependent NADH-azoreductase n=1 Tax=Dyadobacter sp. CY323 TaxID=2907302 RepID=UPI001F20D070|nr:NAD(P)H-dependent oxidoreductase [Dyadobacter sp. CY323]MCE6988067.1 NAD(P)H-dependent oxidoreductase [Dyadobacter sp. CY323]